MYSGLVPEYLHGDIWFFLFTRVPLMALAATGLAIFSSARAAGPLVQLKRAFEDVTGGDLDRRLRFRRSDRSYRELEAAFNAMMVAVGDPARSPSGPEAVLHATPETSLVGDS
jgi:nitrogen fixation/metabolism regulation signal transduction histidine kinase